MAEWWTELTGINQAFYIAAGFFSLIFIWQFLSALIGFGDSGDVDVDADGLDMEAGSLEDAADAVAAFKILSLRAIMASCTLFAWAGAMYLNQGKEMTTVMLYATGWGLAGWGVVTLLVHWLRRLAETGNIRLSTCVGSRGTVYLNIPADRTGEVRVAVSGVMSLVNARSHNSAAINAGTPVRVLRTLDKTTVEVQAISTDND